MSRLSCVLLVLLAGLVALTMGAAPSRSATTACGLPSATPLWIDYGEGSVKADTRAVLAHPGVVVATSGTGVPADFRSHGAATTYWVLHLDRLVGEPADPADPATIPDQVTKLLAQAKTSSACDTPWIALNELLGSGAVAPWSATTTQYRADVLALVQGLAAGGAHPALLVHGDPTVAGATAAWWQQLAQSGDIVYEAYYDASHIHPMGPVMGNRRMRLGIRNVVTLYEGAGIPAARLGVMLGFHSAQTPGIAGRQGLEPTEAWLRVVKWEALAAQQVATEEHLTSIWSWGWGTFGPESVDEDKAAAACAYLWTRDPTLCNAPAVAGVAFNASKVEGQIVVPKGAVCTFAGGRIWQAGVTRLAALTGDPQVALTALFARAALSRAVPVTQQKILAAERAVIARSFHGNRQAYVRALGRRHATLETARGVIGDELRRRAVAASRAFQRFGRAGVRLDGRARVAACHDRHLPRRRAPRQRRLSGQRRPRHRRRAAARAVAVPVRRSQAAEGAGRADRELGDRGRHGDLDRGSRAGPRGLRRDPLGQRRRSRRAQRGAAPAALLPGPLAAEGRDRDVRRPGRRLVRQSQRPLTGGDGHEVERCTW